MSEKYVEKTDTGFTTQYVSKKEEMKNFVLDKQSAATSFNTGVTLDCYDTLFLDYDIFDSGTTSGTTIDKIESTKQAYKHPGKIEGDYPINEYSHIYTSNFTEVVESKMFSGGTIEDKILKNLYKKENILIDLIMPYYEIVKTINISNAVIKYKNKGNNILEFLDSTSGKTNIKDFYKSHITNTSEDKQLVYANYNKLSNFRMYSNGQKYFKEFAGNLVLFEQIITLNFKKLDSNIVYTYDIIIPYGTALCLKRDYTKDIDNRYCAWTFDNGKITSYNDIFLYIKSLNGKRYNDKNEIITSDNDIFLSGSGKVKINDCIFYTNTDFLNEDAKILFIALKSGSGEIGKPTYDLIDSSFNNNIEMHNIFKEKHAEDNVNKLILPDSSTLIYNYFNNNNNFSNISFAMSIDFDDKSLDTTDTKIYAKNLYGVGIDYVYNGVRKVYWLKEYEFERMLTSGNTSLYVMGNSLYLENIIGETKTASYQIRFDDNYPLLLRMYSTTLINKKNYYLIYKNSSGSQNFDGGVLELQINIINNNT